LRIEELGPVGPKEIGVGYSSDSSSNRFLCLADRFRLSSMTRVPAGRKPEARALRRASVDAAKCSFFRFFTRSAPAAFIAHFRRRLQQKGRDMKQSRYSFGWRLKSASRNDLPGRQLCLSSNLNCFTAFSVSLRN